MTLEPRYLILKVQDVRAALSEKEIVALAAMADKVALARDERGAGPLQAVVVEADWPEYRQTCAALELRIRQEQCEHQWDWWFVAGEGKVCRKCGLRDFKSED